MPPQDTATQPQQGQKQQGKHPDPSDGPAYLRSHGWRPIGNPDWPGCLWEDPTKPLIATETKVAKYAYDQTGTKFEQVRQRDGEGQPQPVMQTVFTPAVEPVSFQDAMREQLARDRQPMLEQRRQEAIAKREKELEEAERERQRRQQRRA